MTQQKDPPSLPEEALDKFISYLEGPMNVRLERLLKSKLFLTPIAVSLTVGARTALAIRDRNPMRLVDGGRQIRKGH
jgi:hypothetical protein